MDPVLNTYLKVKNEDIVVQIKEATERQGQYTPAVSMGYSVFDNVMKGGVREGDLVVITGISGDGKTLLALNITAKLTAMSCACLWFTYEVVVDNLYAKFIEMGVEPDKLKIYSPKRLLSGGLKWVKAKIEEGLKKDQTKFVFIDHLDYLLPFEEDHRKSSELTRRQIMIELKKLAVDLRIVIFLIAHVTKVKDKTGRSREVEMQDLGGSAGVFQSPDYILVVQRVRDLVKGEDGKARMIDNYSRIRLLKNRLTGELVGQVYEVANSIIQPLPLSSSETINNVFKRT